MRWKSKNLILTNRVWKLLVNSWYHLMKEPHQVRNVMHVERAPKETDFTMVGSLATLAVLSLGGQLSRRRKMSVRRMEDVR